MLAAASYIKALLTKCHALLLKAVIVATNPPI